MSTQKTIAMFAVLCVIALGLGYWVGMPPPPPPPPPDPLKQGLVAYYPFNGNAKDESGNGHDGDIVGATLCTNRFGVADSAFTFTAGNFIRVKDTFSESLTITIWGLNPAPKSNSMIWCFGDLQTGPDLLWYQNHFCLNTYDIQDRPVNAFCVYQLKPNSWSQYVTVISPEKTELYIDGVMVGKAQYRDPSGKPFIINKIDAPWLGQIDDIRIYNRALSEAEVKELYELEKPKTQQASTKQLTLEEKDIVGTYDALRWHDQSGSAIRQHVPYRMVFLDNDVREYYKDNLGENDLKWSIVDNEVHIAWRSDNLVMVYKIYPDKSITHIADIRDGKRTDRAEGTQPTYKKIK